MKIKHFIQRKDITRVLAKKKIRKVEAEPQIIIQEATPVEPIIEEPLITEEKPKKQTKKNKIEVEIPEE